MNLDGAMESVVIGRDYETCESATRTFCDPKIARAHEERRKRDYVARIVVATVDRARTISKGR